MHFTPILSFNFHISYQKPFWLYHFQQTFLVYFVLRCEKTVNNYHHRHTCIRRQKLLLKYKSFTQHLTNTYTHTHTSDAQAYKMKQGSWNLLKSDFGMRLGVQVQKKKQIHFSLFFIVFYFHFMYVCVCVQISRKKLTETRNVNDVRADQCYRKIGDTDMDRV